jgi:hypothetical protein
MTSKLINFECFRLSKDEAFEYLISEVNIAASNGYTSVIGLLLADGFLHKNNDTWNSVYNRVIDYCTHINIGIKIVSGMSHNNAVNCETIPFNFNLHTVYNSYKNAELLPYNSNTGKFLFLGGVPDRLNRIKLLYDLYNQRLLTHAEWSFFPPWTLEQKENSLQYFPSTKDYYDFIQFAERKFDTVYESSKTYGTGETLTGTPWTHDSSWIDPTVFANTSLSIISEGHPGDDNNNSKFLTEKTYRVFVQGHPFLFAGNVQMFEYIKELGFKTFEEYFPNPTYATIKDESKRLELLVDNLKHFVYNNDDYSKDVEYNRNRFFELAQTNLKILDSLDADAAEIDFYFNRKGFGHLL